MQGRFVGELLSYDMFELTITPTNLDLVKSEVTIDYELKDVGEELTATQVHFGHYVLYILLKVI